MENDKSLVDEFDNLQKTKKEIEDKIAVLRREIIAMAIQKNTNIIFGTHKKCSIKEFTKIVYPKDKEALTKIIRDKGLYERFSSINYFKLGPSILRGEVDKDILDLVKKEKDFRVSLIEVW